MEPGPSFARMAEAMLQNDDFKSSHTSLIRFMEREAETSNGGENEQSSNDIPNIESDMPRKKRGGPLVPRASSFSSSDKKSSEARSVFIQVPPKRRKISTPYTSDEVVTGKCTFARETQILRLFIHNICLC